MYCVCLWCLSEVVYASGSWLCLYVKSPSYVFRVSALSVCLTVSVRVVSLRSEDSASPRLFISSRLVVRPSICLSVYLFVFLGEPCVVSPPQS